MFKYNHCGEKENTNFHRELKLFGPTKAIMQYTSDIHKKAFKQQCIGQYINLHTGWKIYCTNKTAMHCTSDIHQTVFKKPLCIGQYSTKVRECDGERSGLGRGVKPLKISRNQGHKS